MAVSNPLGQPHILVIYYSLSGQSRGLVNLLTTGMRASGAEVTIEKIHAVNRIKFPFRGMIHTLWKMLITFLRVRTPINPPAAKCYEPYDLMVLAGPTWSYNPSGPVLSLLDLYGEKLFRDQRVMPLLSCRGYYRIHDYTLRLQLQRCGAKLEKSLIFKHPVAEPWSTLGVFLKSAGYNPVKMDFLSSRFPHFGHSQEQLRLVKELGILITEHLKNGRPLNSLASERGALNPSES